MTTAAGIELKNGKFYEAGRGQVLSKAHVMEALAALEVENQRLTRGPGVASVRYANMEKENQEIKEKLDAAEKLVKALEKILVLAIE